MAVEISLRTAPRGGGIRQPGADDRSKLLGASRLLLLVHGYNNDLAFARDTAYPGFESLQREIAGVGAGGDYAPGWRVVKVFWPGDADYGLASALLYPAVVRNAPACGESLARLLDESAGAEGLEVAMISHSLGCRVVAELLKALPAASRVHVTRVAFFAAAVGIEKLEDLRPGSLGRAFGTRIEGGALSLYSGADMVLALAFPLGQTLAPGDEGFLPTALGHALWATGTAGASVRQVDNAGAGHSDYWGWKAETRESCAFVANEAARSHIGLGPPTPRALASRAVACRPTAGVRTSDARVPGQPVAA